MSERSDGVTLAAGLQKPIRTGWALWARSAGRIAAHVAPIAAVVGLSAGFLGRSPGVPFASPPARSALMAFPLLILLGAAFGVALVGVILSQRYTGVAAAGVFATTLRRFVPWVLTWLLMIVITFIGYVVFVFQFILGWAQYVVVVPVVFLALILTAGIGMIGSPLLALGLDVFVLFVVGLVAYGALHGPEMVQFYRMRADRSNVEAGAGSLAARRGWGLVIAIVAGLGALFVVGIIASVAIPNFLSAVDRGKAKRTVADSRAIALAMEVYAVANDEYPQAESIAELESRDTR